MKYSQIIDMPYHVSTKHYPMSVYSRAAQFAPFAALSGYSDEISETARLTDEKLELDEGRAAVLDIRTQLLIEHSAELPEIEIEYFIPDKQKSGGAYHIIKGCFRRYDSYAKNIVLSDGTAVSISDIYSIKGDIFTVISAER